MKKRTSITMVRILPIPVLLLCCSLHGRAQEHFTYRSQLDTVRKAGFYKIAMTPDILARCKDDLSDLRIKNPAGDWVFYVLKSETDESDAAKIKYTGIAYPALIQKDSSDDHSYIALQYRARYRIDRLTLLLQGPSSSKRKVRVYDTKNGGKLLVAVSMLSPDSSYLSIPAVRTDSLLVDIANGAAKPLVIQAVQTTQLPQYLLAWLTPGSGYVLLAGNAHTKQPYFGVKDFTYPLSNDPWELQAGPLQPVSPQVTPRIVRLKNGHSEMWLWGVLILILGSLTYLSLKRIQKYS